MAEWKPGKFYIAMPGGPVEKAGYLCNGLGIFQAISASKGGKRPATWSLTHTGSGHAVCYMSGAKDIVLQVSALIANSGDWSFDGLEGYKNQFPDAAAKVSAIMAAHPKLFTKKGSGGRSEEVARSIAAANGR